MQGVLCWVWPYLFGFLLGWLAAGWLAHRALARAPATVQRVVEKIIDRPVERIVEKFVEKPVDRVVERVVEKVVEIPVDRVVERVVEKIVEIPVDRVVERVVEKIVEKPVDRVVERVLEKTVLDSAGLQARDHEIALWRSRFAEMEHQLQRALQGPPLDLAKARAAGFDVKGAKELDVLEGIGPKIGELLRQAGVFRFWQLAQMVPAEIRLILEAAGPQFQMTMPDTWPEQAALAANNHWRALRTLQDMLNAGVRK